MKHPAKSGTHKVVVVNGSFFACPVEDSRYRETNASCNERGKLVKRVGLREDGSLPGLLDWYAMRLARQMEAAGRKRRRGRRA